MTSLPWFRFFPSDWLGGTRGLRPAEAGIYIHLLAMMYERGEPILEDIDKLARLCGATPAAFRKVLEQLVEDGKIQRSNGHLWNARVAKEIANRDEKSTKAKRAAEKSWQKRQRNQGEQDANAMRPQSERYAIPEATSQRPERAVKARDLSSPSSTSQEEPDRPAPDGAPPGFEEEITPPSVRVFLTGQVRDFLAGRGTVTAVNPSARTVTVRMHETGETLSQRVPDDATLGPLSQDLDDELPF